MTPEAQRPARRYDDETIVGLLQRDCGLSETQAIAATARLPIEVRAHDDLFWILDMACIEYADSDE